MHQDHPVVLPWLNSLLAPCFTQPWGSFQGVQRRGLLGHKERSPRARSEAASGCLSPLLPPPGWHFTDKVITCSDTAPLGPAAVFFSLLLTVCISSSQRDEGIENRIKRPNVCSTVELVNISSHTQKGTHRFKHVI